MAVLQQTSADNLLSLLSEEDAALQHYALDSLNKVVHEFWFQISSSLATVESLHEDEGFKDRQLAALVASKVCPGQRSCSRAQWACAIQHSCSLGRHTPPG